MSKITKIHRNGLTIVYRQGLSDALKAFLNECEDKKLWQEETMRLIRVAEAIMTKKDVADMVFREAVKRKDGKFNINHKPIVAKSRFDHTYLNNGYMHKKELQLRLDYCKGEDPSEVREMKLELYYPTHEHKTIMRDRTVDKINNGNVTALEPGCVYHTKTGRILYLGHTPMDVFRIDVENGDVTLNTERHDEKHVWITMSDHVHKIREQTNGFQEFMARAVIECQMNFSNRNPISTFAPVLFEDKMFQDTRLIEQDINVSYHATKQTVRIYNNTKPNVYPIQEIKNDDLSIVFDTHDVVALLNQTDLYSRYLRTSNTTDSPDAILVQLEIQKLLGTVHAILEGHIDIWSMTTNNGHWIKTRYNDIGLIAGDKNKMKGFRLSVVLEDTKKYETKRLRIVKSTDNRKTLL